MQTELKGQIKEIDRKVATIHRKFRRLETIDLDSSASWQAARDKHPDLDAEENELYRQRGLIQAQLAQAEYEAIRPKKRQDGRRFKTYPAARADGKVVQVTIPED